MRRFWASAVGATLLVGPSGASQALDRDRDGLDDGFEQQLIDRFLPQFQISANDCDGRPAAFAPDRSDPVVTAKNGTLYAQAAPMDRPGQPGVFVELHYFHLWSRDCGPNGHPLDAEHVSAIVRADTAGAPSATWLARYWYAAAHQDTACDASQGARADVLDAEACGPAVWVSRGKHASFLSADLCAWGCGVDRCGDSVPLGPAAVVNLGERGAPMNGAIWIASPRWPLADRLRTNFSEDTIERLDRAKPREILAINEALAPFKAVVLGGSSVASGLATGQRETGGAFGKAFRAVGRALKTVGTTLIGKGN